ncbi:hypothetical protein N431DRAFT_428819 [Stipitochalara longipes BDJ]|nr:hypothetical protein N431DRAFT_428819 [Stipitochalara longipes BDJ]
MPPKTKTKAYTHQNLIFTPSSHASKAGYKQPTPRQLIAATTAQGTILNPVSSSSSEPEEHASTFPAPLVLPGDELSWEPTYNGQSVGAWVRGSYRNEITRQRRTLYLVSPPVFGKGLEEAEAWKKPVLKGKKKQEKVGWTEKDTENVLEYLRAFYYGMEVKMMPRETLCFAADVDEEPVPPPPVKKSRKTNGKTKSKESKAQSATLWLNTHASASLLGVRTRSISGGPYSHQLNLNDILEAAMEILPQDAYAIVMLVEHDIFEDEEDDFACGRAYGGSRVCVVSTARYDPALDGVQCVPRNHGWPASHCKDYIDKCVEEAEEDEEEEEVQPKQKKQKKSATEKNEEGTRNGVVSPMQAALTAHLSLPSLETSPSAEALSGLWLGRLCRTASHELGHCFGLDHCVYYACCMQGTASIIEDARQPPYLCPVDLQKVLYATGADESERYKRLEEFCGKFGEVQMFRALAAWIRGRIGQPACEKQENTMDNPILILD